MATKLEILQGYSKEKQLASWYILGKNTIKVSSNPVETTKIFTKGILYLLECPESELHHCLIYCTEDYIGNLEWEQAELADSSFGYITFGSDILSPNFRFITNAPQVYADPYNEYVPEESDEMRGFIPFQAEKNSTDVVQISDEDYERCITCLGAPFVIEEELEYTRDQIINLAIKPAIEEYYKWFPKIRIDTFKSAAQVQDVEFPSDAYDIVHFSVQQYGNNANGMITNTLLRAWTESMYGINNRVGAISGVTSSYNSQMTNYFNNRAYSQAILNYNTRSHIDKYIKDGKRYARFYSTKSGTLEIHWAIKTLNFSETEFARRPELYKLCNANVKLLFGNLRRQAKSDIPGLVNYGDWVTEAKTEIQEVREDWQKLVKYAGVMRGSL